jgi:hypothetical protein
MRNEAWARSQRHRPPPQWLRYAGWTSLVSRESGIETLGDLTMLLNCSKPATGNSRLLVRWSGALFVVGLLASSWFVRVPGNPLASWIVAFVAIIGLMVTVELLANTDCKLSKSCRWRIRRAQVDSAWLLRGVWPILLSAIVGSAAFWILCHTRHSVNIPTAVLRLAAGVALLYALAEFIFEVCSLCFRVAGYSLPLMHRAPIGARSVGEFWGQRWNLVVSAWLRMSVFWPLARRRLAGVGVLCCFLVSGALHGWPMLVSLGTFAAASTLVFFVIQGVVVLAENRLRIHTWPIAMARAWTLGILLVSSPLLIDPGLRLFGL